MNTILYYINKFFYKEKKLSNLTKEQALGLMSQLYQNDAFRRYLDARERYLIDNGMEQFIIKKGVEADKLAGQLIEIRTLRARIKSAYLIIEKQHSTLKKEQK